MPVYDSPARMPITEAANTTATSLYLVLGSFLQLDASAQDGTGFGMCDLTRTAIVLCISTLLGYLMFQSKIGKKNAYPLRCCAFAPGSGPAITRRDSMPVNAYASAGSQSVFEMSVLLHRCLVQVAVRSRDSRIGQLGESST